MRLLIVGAALLFSVSTTAAAQSRWTLSAGPEWTGTLSNGHFYGGRLRAEYDLITPTSPFRLRLEAGTFWSPDRKSTRLNSSHLVISYAVFCLKKKKK